MKIQEKGGSERISICEPTHEVTLLLISASLFKKSWIVQHGLYGTLLKENMAFILQYMH